MPVVRNEHAEYLKGELDALTIEADAARRLLGDVDQCDRLVDSVRENSVAVCVGMLFGMTTSLYGLLYSLIFIVVLNGLGNLF